MTAETISIPECWTSLEGRRLRYLHGGSGPPVVLLHGFLGGSFCWRFTLPALAEHYCVYALDLPGLSSSEAAPETDCGMAAQARRVLSFIDRMELRDVHLIGCSFGGAVALHAALLARRQMAGRLRSLVLSSPVNPWSKFGRKRLAILRTFAGGMLLRLVLPHSRPLLPWGLRRLYADPARIPSGTLDGYGPQVLQRGRAVHLLSAIRSWKKDVEVMRSSLDKIDIPALLVWGDRDRAVDPASCAALEQRLTGCKTAWLPGVGHLPFEESPVEFNRVVMDFLSEKRKR